MSSLLFLLIVVAGVVLAALFCLLESESPDEWYERDRRRSWPRVQ